jgi:hypothetical protein
MVEKSGRIGKASVRLDPDLNPIPPESSVLLLFKYDQCLLWHHGKIPTCFNFLPEAEYTFCLFM